jgi:hypothetical protein
VKIRLCALCECPLPLWSPTPWPKPRACPHLRRGWASGPGGLMSGITPLRPVGSYPNIVQALDLEVCRESRFSGRARVP